MIAEGYSGKEEPYRVASDQVQLRIRHDVFEWQWQQGDPYIHNVGRSL